MPRTLLLLAALLLGFSSVAAAQDYDVQGEAQMLEQINTLRAENQLPAISRLESLDEAARGHSAEMAASGQLAHVSSTTGTPEDRVRGAGVTPLRVTENVANHRDTMGAHAALLASPPHRQNVLDPNVTHVGLGSVRTEQGVFVTQLYAALSEQAPASAPQPVLEPAPPAPRFELIPPFVERAMEEAAAPLITALTDGDEAPAADHAEPAAAPTTTPADHGAAGHAPDPVDPPVASAPPPISEAPPAPPQMDASAPSATLSPLAEQTLRGLVGFAQSLLGANSAPNPN